MSWFLQRSTTVAGGNSILAANCYGARGGLHDRKERRVVPRSTPLAHYQQLVFNWITAQSGLTGLVVMAAGLLAASHGFRMVRFLLAVCGFGVGYGAASVLGSLVPLPPSVLGLVAGSVCAAAGVAWPQPARVVVSAVTWAIGGAYLAEQFGARGLGWWIPAGLLGATGGVLMLVSPRSMTILMTSLHGAALFLLGFAGVADAVLPVLGGTLRSWAHHRSAILPILLGMLTLTAYSCQANARRGDLRTGHADGPPVTGRQAARPPVRANPG